MDSAAGLRRLGAAARWTACSSVGQWLLCLALPLVIASGFYAVKSKNFRWVTVAQSPVTAVEGVRWFVDTVKYDPVERRYTVNGWAAETRRDASWLKTRVLLAPVAPAPTSGLLNAIEVKTNLLKRPDVSLSFADGRDRHHSGFSAQIKAKWVPVGSQTRVLLAIERGGEPFVIDTGSVLP